MNEGFLLIKNHGVDPQDVGAFYNEFADNVQMQRVFDIANWLMLGDAMTEQDKVDFAWDRENGDWMGYKSPKGWGEVGGALHLSLTYVERKRRIRQYRGIQSVWSMLGEGEATSGDLAFCR